jgi:hypothetical protein
MCNRWCRKKEISMTRHLTRHSRCRCSPNYRWRTGRNVRRVFGNTSGGIGRKIIGGKKASIAIPSPVRREKVKFPRPRERERVAAGRVRLVGKNQSCGEGRRRNKTD